MAKKTTMVICIYEYNGQKLKQKHRYNSFQEAENAAAAINSLLCFPNFKDKDEKLQETKISKLLSLKIV